MLFYTESEKWADIVPISQDDGGPNPLAAIAYPDDYSEAMSYLRAVMARNEKSERVLELTADIIDMNPAHYTVWLYRASVLLTLQSDLLQEIAWLKPRSLKHLKNYQIWHHRQVIMSHILSLPPDELPFLARMFVQDAKNYHVWSYRQWLVRHFSLWETELPQAEALLKKDLLNNSAWNHRWFVVFCKNTDPNVHSIKKAFAAAGTELKVEHALVQREIDYAKEAIHCAPQNQSPWNYLRAVLRVSGQKMGALKAFAEGFADLEKKDEVRSSHALDFLADAYAEAEEKEKAALALEMLATRFDPIRKNYWNYRRGLLMTEV